jgi:Nucleotidyl transferase AbiEii toxin, Type IV TA system
LLDIFSKHGMINEIKNFTHKLEQAEIPYMITGGIALLLYTLPRSTQDIDIVLEIHQNKVAKFIELFSVGYYHNDEEIKEEVKRKGMFNLIDLTTFFRIDCIIRNEDEFERHKFARRKKQHFEGIDIWVIDLNDLILSKLRWIQQIQSGKQMEDIKSLLQNPHIDKAYLQTWIQKLSLKTFDLW